MVHQVSLLIVTLLLPFLAYGQSPGVPFGIFEITALKNRKAMLFISETHSVFGPVAYLASLPPKPNDHVDHINFWRVIWQPENGSFFAEGFNRRDVNAVQVQFDNSNQMHGAFVTTDDRFSPPGPLIDQIHFEGRRLPEEIELEELAARSSIVNSDRFKLAEGAYEALPVPTEPKALTLRSYMRAGTRKWIGSYHIGKFTVPLTGEADENGLLRLVRTPTSSPSELNALTGTVIEANGNVEFHGIFFVPRNNKISPIVMRKVRSVE